MLRSKDDNDVFPTTDTTFVMDGGLVYGWPDGDDWRAVEGTDGEVCGYFPLNLYGCEFFREAEEVSPE